MKKFMKIMLMGLCAVALFAGCSGETETTENPETSAEDLLEKAAKIVLSDNGVTLDGEAVSSDSDDSVYVPQAVSSVLKLRWD